MVGRGVPCALRLARARKERTMATKGQTHQKRARELALKERRERKQAKKEAQRAEGKTTLADDANTAPDVEGEPRGPGWVQ
jgi:hypothetical protein